jgi:hypothetical protein
MPDMAKAAFYALPRDAAREFFYSQERRSSLVKAFSVSVRRPDVKTKGKENTMGSSWRGAMVLSESFDDAAKKAVAYYNDVDDVDDYFVTGASVYATTDEGEGDVLIV